MSTPRSHKLIVGSLNVRYIETRVMDKFMQTEITQALKTIVFKLLKMNVI